MSWQRLRAVVAWGWVATLVAGGLVLAVVAFRTGHGLDELPFIGLPAVLAAAGALIFIRRPGNSVAWLLFIPAVGGQAGDLVTLPLLGTTVAPPHPGLITYLGLMYGQISWMALMFPLLVLPHVFPTGRVLGPAWRWFPWLAAGMVAVLSTLSVFTDTVSYGDPSIWTVPNPIGFIPSTFSADDSVFILAWTIGLVALALGGVLSAFLRYRRAGQVERQQIKWLLYAFVLFGIVYAAAALASMNSVTGEFGLPGLGLLLPLSIYCIPVALTIAVLRYRLFDIDVIIRRTAAYGAVIVLLGTLYAGLVIALRSLLPLQGSLPVALSTLVVAFAFLPLVRRVQRAVDRRFFRSRFEPAVVVARMAGELRGRLDLDDVVEHAAAVLNDVYSPESIGVWIADP